jgi:hypothetical protein
VEDAELREAAIARLKAKRDFWMHLFIYVAVNTFLVVVWVVNGADGHFWPIWSMAGWAIGLGAHAIETFAKPIREEAIRREIEKARRE